MDYIRITDDNIEKEHICCAMSGKQGVIKKEWLKQRFKEGLVFCRSTERGKCFIEYIPAENAWVPIQADGYFYIDCLWVSGSLKGHGYSNDLLGECIRAAKEQGRKGLCILSSGGRKREFLSDPKYLAYKGFAVADTSECGINLMYLPLAQDAEPPRFKACAKHPAVEESGFVLYYTDQCPFTYYWVSRVEEAARAYHVPLKVIHVTSREQAQSVPAPVTTYALFKDGSVVPAGEGDGSVPSILKTLAETGKPYMLTLEPHLYDFSGLQNLQGEDVLHKRVYKDADEAFDVASDALHDILKTIE